SIRMLAPASVDKRAEEPKRRVAPRGCQRFVFLFPLLRQDATSLLPYADGLQTFLPPPRPRASPAHYLGSGLMTDLFQTAALKQHWELASKGGVISARCPPSATPCRAVIQGRVRMGRIHRSNCAPVAVLIHQPSSRSQTLHHVPDSRLLPAREPEQG